MTANRSRRRLLFRLPVLLLGLLVVGTFVAATPVAAQGRSYATVSSLPGATRADRIVVGRVNIDLPIRKGVVGGTIREGIAYHYPGTSWPGGDSNTYLYSHARAGSFLNLKYVKTGDIVRLRLATGNWVRYRVTTVKRVAWNDSKWTLLTSTERLTLQTCTGNTKTADRLVVVAVPVD